MIDRVGFEDGLRSCTARCLWGTALTICGGFGLVVGGIALAVSEAPAGIFAPVLGVCGAILVGGIILLVQAHLGWRPVKAALPFGQAGSFESGWQNPAISFGPDGYASFVADGGCLYCGVAAPPTEQARAPLVSAKAQQGQATRHLLFGVLGSMTADTKDKRGRQAQGIPLDAKGLVVSYSVCDACKPARPDLKWTGWAALVGLVLSLLAAAVILSGGGASGERLLPLKVAAIAIPFLVGGSLGLAGLTARQFGHPLRIRKVDVNNGIVIQLPKHLTLRPTQAGAVRLP